MLVDNLGQAVRTQLVDGLLADLLQAVRFLHVYICIIHSMIIMQSLFSLIPDDFGHQEESLLPTV